MIFTLENLPFVLVVILFLVVLVYFLLSKKQIKTTQDLQTNNLIELSSVVAEMSDVTKQNHKSIVQLTEMRNRLTEMSEQLKKDSEKFKDFIDKSNEKEEEEAKIKDFLNRVAHYYIAITAPLSVKNKIGFVYLEFLSETNQKFELAAKLLLNKIRDDSDVDSDFLQKKLSFSDIVRTHDVNFLVLNHVTTTTSDLIIKLRHTILKKKNNRLLDKVIGILDDFIINLFTRAVQECDKEILKSSSTPEKEKKIKLKLEKLKKFGAKVIFLVEKDKLKEAIAILQKEDKLMRIDDVKQTLSIHLASLARLEADKSNNGDMSYYSRQRSLIADSLLNIVNEFAED